MSLLQVNNLVVEFPTRRGTLRALDDISFDIAPGEILGVVGESGAGKSLTGASIIGLLEPPGRIVFSWSIAGQGDDDPSIVTLDITPTAVGCSLRLTHEMDEKWADFVDRSRAGWQKMLGVLTTLL